MMADFRDVVGFPSYRVSRDGVIVNSAGHPLATYTTKRGYVTTTLGYGNSVKVHRVVAMAWIPNPNEYPQVNHIDGNKSNNAASNLEWATDSQNIAHAFANGLHPNPEKPVAGVCMETGAGIWAKSQHAVGHFGFQYRRVNDCLRGRSKSHGGYVWSYA